MELKTAIEILEYHQKWRLGKREDMIHEPKKLTEALDVVLREVKKNRLGNVMPRFLAKLKANWKPETITETSYGYHGSSKGDKIECILYFDSYRFEWTTKNRAFQGFVFKEIDKFLK